MSYAKKLLAIFLLIFGSVSGAMAQDAGDSAFKRDRNISVKERPKPEYSTDGIRSGMLVYRPELVVTSEYDSNIFAAETNTDDDVIISIAPRIDIETDRNVHNVRVFAEAERREYLSFGSESHTNYRIGTEGRLDVQRDTYVDAGISYRRDTEDRSRAGAARDTVDPLAIDRLEYFVRGHREAGRIRVQAEAAFGDVSYEDAELPGGIIEDQGFRDRDSVDLELRADYAVSPNTSIFGRVRYEDDNYRETPGLTSRDQDGYVIDAGADFDLTDLVRGEIGIGLLKRTFDDPARSNFDGLSVNGRLEWFATPLITVNAQGSRRVLPSDIVASGASVENRIGLSADYEWRRNIVLSVGSEYEDQDYRDADRDDERLTYYASGSYLMNRTVSINAGVYHTRYDSDGLQAQNDFDKVEVLFGITLRR